MEFLSPFFLGGLAAMSVPVIIHLLHRRKIKQVDWGAMRFLLEMLAKRRRRIFLEELLLMLVRVLLIACVAMAMVRPALHKASDENTGKGISRQGGTASVLLIDDSISSSSGRAQPAFESMKKLGAAYLDSLAAGDEVSIVLMSQLGGASSDPIFDIEAVKTQLNKSKPGYIATDIPALIDAGLNQLKRHVNPGAELVLLTDARKDGWRENDKPRWDDLRQRLRGPKEAAIGTRQRPQLILLSPMVAPVDDNVAITALAMDRSLVSAGQPAGVRVTISNFGRANRSVTVQLSVDGQAIGSKQIEIPTAGQQEVVFPYTFPDPGSYAVEASLLDNQDFLPADDRRAFSVQVETSLPVLLVEDAQSQGLESKLGFMQYALSPESDKSGPFTVTRIPITQFTPSLLASYRAVVIADVKLLEPAMVDALERYVVGGGGVLVGLGPDSDLALINKYWARGGEGFLPCPLERAVTPATAAIPAGINLGHAALAGFGSKNDEAWRSAKVKSYYKLDTRNVKQASLDVLLRLDSGDPLIVERRRGLGLVCLFTTSMNADWTDLPVQAAYVPLVRGIVGQLGSFITPPRNLVPGEQIIYARVKDPSQAMQGEDCNGKPLKLALGAWEGRDAIISEPLSEPGLYSLRDPKELKPIRFAVALAPSESPLAPITDREMSQVLDGNGSFFHTPEQIAQTLDPARRQSVELWKWFVLAAIFLVFLEGWMTRREARHASAAEAAK